MEIENDRLLGILYSLREYAESDLIENELVYNDPDSDFYEDLIVGESIREAQDTIAGVDAILEEIERDEFWENTINEIMKL